MPKLAIQKPSIFKRVLDRGDTIESYDDDGKAKVNHAASARANYQNALEGIVDVGKSIVGLKKAYDAWSPAGSGGAPGILTAAGGALFSATLGVAKAKVNTAQGLMHSLVGAAKTLIEG